MSLMVASNGILGTSSVPAAPVIMPVQAGRMTVVKRRDSGDSESRSTHSSSNGSSAVDDHSPNKIFVGGISFQTTAEKLRSYFAPYGTILDVMVLKDPATNRNRGFGFVTFADVDSVNKVLNQDEHLLDGKKIDPKLATPKGQKAIGEQMMPRKVFVGGVSQETNSQELLDYFTQFGKVLECSLQMDNNTKRHRGFAFVTFENEDNSARVVRKHHHVVKNKTVECKYAQPKETIQASERAKRAQLLTMMQTAAVANPLSPLAAAAHAQQIQQHYSRVMSAGGGAFSGLASFRYAPYTVPAITAAATPSGHNSGHHHHHHQLGALGQLGAAAALPTSMSPAALQSHAASLQSHTASLHNPAAAAAAAAAAAGGAPYQLANFDMSAATGLHGLEWGAAAPLYSMYTA